MSRTNKEPKFYYEILHEFLQKRTFQIQSYAVISKLRCLHLYILMSTVDGQKSPQHLRFRNQCNKSNYSQTGLMQTRSIADSVFLRTTINVRNKFRNDPCIKSLNLAFNISRFCSMSSLALACD